MRMRQKVKYPLYRISNYEVQEAYMTMARYNLSVLIEYKKYRKHIEYKYRTYPGFDEADTLEKWEALLDQLIYTFYEIVKDYPHSPVEQTLRKIRIEHSEAVTFNTPTIPSSKQIDNSIYCPVIKPGYEQLYQQYVTEEMEQEEMVYRQHIQEGLQLFGKFYLYIRTF